MKQRTALEHKFVSAIPDKLEDRVLYVSLDYATAVHKCCCGCGHEVVTPLSPTDWKVTYDGVSVSLYPSIGNWGFDCRSHYWIQNSRVKWAEQWSKEQIAAGRAWDKRFKQAYYDGNEVLPAEEKTAGTQQPAQEAGQDGLWSRLKKWWSR